MDSFYIRSVILLLSLSSFYSWGAGESDSYKIGAGDTISIVVYAEEDLSKEVLINSSGQLDYPYIGPIMAKGKTTSQLQMQITKSLRGDYLVDPKVMVNVVEYRKVYINGEVKQPGGYEFQPGLTVDKAIALAGGFTDRAAKDKINVSSNTAQLSSRSVSLSSNVQPGDIIVIEQSFF